MGGTVDYLEHNLGAADYHRGRQVVALVDSQGTSVAEDLDYWHMPLDLRSKRFDEVAGY